MRSVFRCSFGTISYQEFGDSSKPCVVFLVPKVYAKQPYEWIVDSLSSNCRLIFVDFFETEKTHFDYRHVDTPSLVKGVTELLDSLHIDFDSTIFIGESHGGNVLSHVASLKGCHKLILIGSGEYVQGFLRLFFRVFMPLYLYSSLLRSSYVWFSEKWSHEFFLYKHKDYVKTNFWRRYQVMFDRFSLDEMRLDASKVFWIINYEDHIVTESSKTEMKEFFYGFENHIIEVNCDHQGYEDAIRKSSVLAQLILDSKKLQ